MRYPRIHLAIDNCFASKRWTAPSEWTKIVRSIGLDRIEASADTELDPLYMGEDYLLDWVRDVRSAEKDDSVKVVNLYSGHGTYATLGLAHPDARVRKRMIEGWFKPFLRAAAELEAGAGFYAHAFRESVMQDPIAYQEHVGMLMDGLVEIASYARIVGCRSIGLEQMYAPHMVPWRIEETRALIREVTIASGQSFYFTEDVGHHQVKFVRPTRERIEEGIRSGQPPWLGASEAYRLFDQACRREITQREALQRIEGVLDRYPHMFSSLEDGDCYEWLRRLGAYSPIVHLQQTNGMASGHLHFTEVNNQTGTIHPRKILEAIRDCYDRVDEHSGMPPRVEDIHLTLELFTGTTAVPCEVLRDCRESVRFWSDWIPVDGLRLDELLS